MNKIFNTTRTFLFSKQSSIFSSGLILAAMIIVARFFGFLRYRVLAGYFTKSDLDIFFASFRIPDLIFEILITGALTTSFIPIFIKYQNNKSDLNENISSIINIIFIVMIGLIILMLLLLDWLIPLITPGYTMEKTLEITYYSRLLLIGQLPFLIIGSILTGIGQAKKSFLLPSLAPVVYNLAIILVTFFFASRLRLFAPIIGVIGGAVFYALIQLPVLRLANFQLTLLIKKTQGLIEFSRMIIPRTLTVIVAQIDATIDLSLTTLLGTGVYTSFYLAQHLQLLPVSIIGIAFGQAALPYLTEIYQSGRIDELKKIITDSILNLLFLVIPIASFLIFARTPVVRLFFGGQMFDWQATVLTAIILSWFAISIPFHTIYYFLTRCFYALLDSRTPFYISLFTILFNTSLSLFFILYLRLPAWSLALSFSLSMIINVLLLFYFLNVKTSGLFLSFIVGEISKITSCAFLASVFIYYLIKLLDGLVFDTSRTINVFFLLLTAITIYLMVYLFLGWLFDIKEIYLISKLITKAKEYRKRILEIYTSYE